ncbi:MAG TPA: 2'-5' RNA ligase family protein [Candidatus Limnocylindria bacterium]|nr:2'-5' RNA ligase family protein [Candidatus Limnocylindria bacterium]
MVGEGVPYRESAIAIKVRLPTDLERFRVAHVPNAALGVPAHITLIYPFLPADVLSAAVRRLLARALAAHRPFTFRLSGVRRWPNSYYLAVEPMEPFQAIVRSLVDVFPEYPPYAGEFEYVPHVTIAEGADRTVEGLARDLLVAVTEQDVTRILLIAQVRDGTWRIRWTFALRD